MVCRCLFLSETQLPTQQNSLARLFLHVHVSMCVSMYVGIRHTCLNVRRKEVIIPHEDAHPDSM